MLSDFRKASTIEWLEANGVGGWASSTVCGVNTRRYHGILAAAAAPPTGREVLLSRLDEVVQIGALRVELGCRQFPGAVYPASFLLLDSFCSEPFPCFEYKIGQVILRKTIAAVHGENTTLVVYELRSAVEPIVLELQPFVAGRDCHSLVKFNDRINQSASFNGGLWEVRPYPGVMPLQIFVAGALYQEHPQWHLNFEYLRDYERGAEFQEDLFSYGCLKAELKPGDRLGVVVSACSAAGRDAWDLLENERARRRRLQEDLATDDEFIKTLALAADRFVVRRGTDSRSIIAGYPWFTDWGRDTMIALPGLCLATGRHAEAKKIFEGFLPYVSQGMIPNCFPDGGGEPAYNTLDASLWFCLSAYAYYRAARDHGFVKGRLLRAMLEIVEAHRVGTRYKIGMDRDGLLAGGDSDTQLTWMDAKVAGQAVTPRCGKAVEINALWYNALMICAELCAAYGDRSTSRDLAACAACVKRSFEKVFWNEDRGYFNDCVGLGGVDSSLRPNQVIALGLPFELVGKAAARRALKVITGRLLTPFGLRTLDPQDPRYCGRYEGGGWERDHAYHQGTVWPWLLGPYANAVMRYGSAEDKRKTRLLLCDIAQHFAEAGVDSISEIFDGDAPHLPRGCPFQAWSVAEILRAYIELSAEAVG